LITKQESLLQYFLALGEAVFIPTAELWGIKQHFYKKAGLKTRFCQDADKR